MSDTNRKVDTNKSPVSILREALRKIERWHGQFPDTGTGASYATEYGSNGERDYMRQVAHAALKDADPAAIQPAGDAFFVYTGQRGRELEEEFEGINHGTKFYTAPAPLVAPVPDAAEQNGGLVRAALIDLLALDQHTLGKPHSFDSQRDAIACIARARNALAGPVPATRGDMNIATKLMRVLELGDETKPMVLWQGHWYGGSNGVGFSFDKLLEHVGSNPAAPAVKPEASAHKVSGLGSVTSDDDGVLTLRFKDDDAAQAFMRDYEPSVESDDMPKASAAPDAVAYMHHSTGDVITKAQKLASQNSGAYNIPLARIASTVSVPYAQGDTSELPPLPHHPEWNWTADERREILAYGQLCRQSAPSIAVPAEKLDTEWLAETFCAAMGIEWSELDYNADTWTAFIVGIDARKLVAVPDERGDASDIATWWDRLGINWPHAHTALREDTMQCKDLRAVPTSAGSIGEIDGQELHEILAHMAEAVLHNNGEYSDHRAKLVAYITRWADARLVNK